MSKNRNVALLSFSSKFLKLIIAPLSILLVSKKLSTVELSYYYTFFSLISMQQLVELGIGHTIKQFISHSIVDNESRKIKINSYFRFSKSWFLIIASFMLFIVGPLGYLFYLGSSDIEWQLPWVLLVIISALSVNITPYMIYFEAIQKQEYAFKINIYSSIISAVVLCCALYLNAGLYSVSISMFLGITVQVYYIISYKDDCYLNCINKLYSFKNVFSEIWPLLSKVSFIWAIGFFFWNGFNLISFKFYPSDYAGKVVFIISLASTGFFISESITQGQMTIFSKLISEGKVVQSYKLFKKYQKISFYLIFLGYSLFLSIMYFYPNFYFFDKIPNIYIVTQVFVFYIILLLFTTNNNYIRCYKVEPFLKVSLFNSIMVPVTYLLVLNLYHDIAFISCCFILSLSFFYSKKIFNKYVSCYD